MSTLLAVAALVLLGIPAAGATANLIPNPEFRINAGVQPDGWRVWSAAPALAPEASVVRLGSAACLRLQSKRFPAYGKWITSATGIQAGKYYRFSVLYKTQKVSDESVSVAAILSWIGAKSRALQRDFADSVEPQPGGWVRLHRTLRAPEGSGSATIELALRWTENGSVLWRTPELTEVSAPPPRKVRIATTRIQPPTGATLEKNRQLTAETLDQAGAQHPDLVLLTENFPDRGVGLPVAQTAEPIPGPTTRMYSDLARRHKMWVAASLHEADGGLIYNTAVLVDREGRIAGKYRKTHLAMAEGENGITPGSDYPVFDTDFGRVGMLICWDNWFPEVARALRLKGAEILLLPIAGDGVPGHWDVISRARALDNSVYLVASSTSAGSPSRIVDPTGKVLAETAQGIAVAEIDLAQEFRVHWLSVGPADGEARSLYIKERRPDTYKGLGTR